MKRNHLSPMERDCIECRANFGVDLVQSFSGQWLVRCKKCGKTYARGNSKEEALINLRENLKPILCGK